MNIGEKIKKARKALGLTQQELGGGDFTKGYISQLEKGIVNPSMKVIAALATRLNKPAAYFLDEGGSPSRELQDKYIGGENLYLQGEFRKAIVIFDEVARETGDPADSLYALSLLYTGKCLFFMNEYRESQETLRKALLHVLELNACEKAVECYHYIGLCIFNLKNYEEAILEFEKGLNLIVNKGLHMPDTKAKLVLNIGTAYSNVGHFKTALQHFERNIAYCQENNIAETLMDSYLRMGYCSYKLGLYKEAKEHLSKCISVNRLLKSNMIYLEIYHVLGLVLAKEGRYSQSFALLSKSMELAKKIKYPYGFNSNVAGWVSVLIDTGNVEEALNYAAAHLPGLENADNKAPYYLVQGYLGILYMKVDKIEKGIALLEAAVKNFQAQNMRYEVSLYARLLADALLEIEPSRAKHYYDLSFDYSSN